MTADKDRIPRFELSVEEAAAISNMLRELSYMTRLTPRAAEVYRRLNRWIEANGWERDGNGWWRGPAVGKEVAR